MRTMNVRKVRKVTVRKRTLIPIPGIVAAFAVVLAACGEDAATTVAGPGTATATATEPTVTIGIQDPGEGEVLANVYGEVLSANGYTVRYDELGARNAVFSSFAADDGIDLTAEYAGSALGYLLVDAGTPTGAAGPDSKANADALRTLLQARKLTAFTASSAVHTSSLVVTKELATAKGLGRISDLTPDLRLGGPPDCTTDPLCIQGITATYGIDLSARFVPLDGGGPRTKAALGGGEIDVAVIANTDSSLATKPWIALQDDRQLFPADAVIPVLTQELAEAGGEELESLIDGVSAKLTTEELIGMNASFDVDHQDAQDIARTFLTHAGLL